MIIKGDIASKGFAIGKAYCLHKKERTIPKQKITDVQAAIEDFNRAMNKSIEEVENLKRQLEGHHDLFQAHIEMIRDPEIKNRTEQIITHDKLSPAYAYKAATDEFIDVFDMMENVYFKERASDIRDIQNRMLMHLLNESDDEFQTEDDTVIFTDELTPSDAAKLTMKKVRAVVTERGGVTSHSTVIAKAFNLPCLIGVKGLMKKVKNGNPVIVDALAGKVHINPTSSELEIAKAQLLSHQKQQEVLKQYAHKETQTSDGHKLNLYANVGNMIEFESLANTGAEGIGILRTENLFVERETMPTELEQVRYYETFFSAYDDVVVRTFDLSSDKVIPYLKHAHENNPALGERGVRFYFKEPTMFKTQIRALLKASSKQPSLKLVVPFVSHVEEIIKVKSLIQEVMETLKGEHIPYQKSIAMGIMIEVSSAALSSDVLGKHVDFFIIGTNNLIQYYYGIDRMNDAILNLNKPFDPAFLRLIKHVVDAARQTQTELNVCIERVADTDFAEVFVGLGIHTLSVSFDQILPVRQTLNNINYKAACQLASAMLKCHTENEVRNVLKDHKKQ